MRMQKQGRKDRGKVDGRRQGRRRRRNDWRREEEERADQKFQSKTKWNENEGGNRDE